MARPSDPTGEVNEALTLVRPPVDLDGRRNSAETRSARRVQALSLRLAGLSYTAIGERLGVDHSEAADLVEGTLARAVQSNANALRAIEADRLDRAQAAIWTKVLEGDLKAVDTFLRISGRRARMLGLDAPTKINLNVSVRAEMDAALANLEQVIMGEVIATSADTGTADDQA